MDKNALVRKNNARSGMSEEDKAANKARDEQLLRSNLETMKRAPKGELGDAVRMLGEMANQKLKKDIEDAGVPRKPNSVEQYNHERKAGDPNALKLSFEEWKKL
jgi:hypothetical protein